MGISNFDRINRGESQWDDRKLNPNIYWTHLRTTISAILANTNTAASASPPDGPELVWKLRRALAKARRGLARMARAGRGQCQR